MPARFEHRPVRVRVPATSANLGSGFDAFGLALSLYDDVTVQALQVPGLRIDVTGEGADEVPRDADHLVVRALEAGFAALGARPPGLAVTCVNRIPHGRGLGSSAAAVIAGLSAARALHAQDDGALQDDRVDDGRLDDMACLALSARLEGHADNVAACLLGGFVIAWTDGGHDDGAGAVHAVSLPPAPGLSAVVFLPPAVLGTREARRMLPETVPHADAAHAAGRAGLLVEALTRRPELLLAATEDRLHQPYRAHCMPASMALVDALRADGVAAMISGAGPSVLALVRAEDAARVRARSVPGFSARVVDLEGGGATRSVVTGGVPAPEAVRRR